jgi:hypothetical protein
MEVPPPLRWVAALARGDATGPGYGGAHAPPPNDAHVATPATGGSRARSPGGRAHCATAAVPRPARIDASAWGDRRTQTPDAPRASSIASVASIVRHASFGGLSEQETAEALDVTARTVRRDWVKAKAWLYSELTDQA